MEKQDKSRTEYSARNITYAMIGRIAALLMGFVSRIVLTHTLSAVYVGINGLFTDIINVLSLSELGLGTAITYALYKPIAEGDFEKQKSYMRLYRYFYDIVAAVVLVIGLLLIPFLKYIVKSDVDIPHMSLLFMMYIINSCLSYLLVYKKALIDAHQQSYIPVLIQTSSWIIQIFFQIIILITTGNFILYLSMMLLSTIGSNLIISYKASRMFPYIKDKNVEPLTGDEKESIFTNIRAMILHKVGDVAVNNTDNIIISSFIGIAVAGIYSNYFLIIESIKGVFQQVFNGVMASVGNLGVMENKERVKKIYECIFFAGHWAYGVVAVCLYEVISAFVQMSFGECYLFDGRVTLILCINMYVAGMRQSTMIFRDSLGLFYYDRYKSIVAAVVNIVASIALCKFFGVAGVFLGTLICSLSTYFWVEPWVLYRKCFGISPRNYFVKYILYASSTAIVWYMCDRLCRFVQGSNIYVFIVRGVVCFAIVNLFYLLLYFRTNEFKWLKEKTLFILRKRFHINGQK